MALGVPGSGTVTSKAGLGTCTDVPSSPGAMGKKMATSVSTFLSFFHVCTERTFSIALH